MNEMAENVILMCKYCGAVEDKQTAPGLVCEICTSFVHLKCLRRHGTPGDFACDVFFDFTCEDCSHDKTEIFKRNKFPWVSVIMLTLHHLSITSYGISNHGFFHYKTHICSFIGRNWNALFGNNFKQKKNWVGTIAGALSVYNQLFFKSGSVVLGETGWWKMLHNFSPAVAAHILQEVSKDKPKGRPRNQLALDKPLFLSKIIILGYSHLAINEDDNNIIPVKLEPAAKKRRVDSDDSSTSHYEHLDSDNRNDVIEEVTYSDAYVVESRDVYTEEGFKGFDVPVIQSDSSSLSNQPSYQLNYDSDSRSLSPSLVHKHSDDDKDSKIEVKKKDEKIVVRKESFFSSQLNSGDDLPWLDPEPEPQEDVTIIEMTQYEEIQLLKKVEGLIPKVKEPNQRAYLYRLKAKLALRRLKRHKHLPLFDFDKSVKLLGGFATEDAITTTNIERVLDRFQRSYLIDNLSGTISGTNYGTILVSQWEASPFRSPYSGALIKPYIRRDRCTKPLWPRVMQELLVKTHSKTPNYIPPPLLSLDYSYVRPHHIPAVNNLCAQYFWQGIDVSESLQYPEFSCVVTYGRIVVACAFLVPNALAGDAYISFVLTRPEWRGNGIATFMLYHLLQTCSGKDVTLHVSPTNPAIFLYQKFGFKVEELIQDFYEKYYDIDYKGCRHALFLRLVR